MLKSDAWNLSENHIIEENWVDKFLEMVNSVPDDTMFSLYDFFFKLLKKSEMTKKPASSRLYLI